MTWIDSTVVTPWITVVPITRIHIGSSPPSHPRLEERVTTG